MPLSISARQAMLNHYFNITPHTPATNFYLACFTTAPAVNGSGGVEVSGGSYARLNFNDFDPATGSNPVTVTNGSNAEFVQATASWGTIVYIGIYTASSGGVFCGGGAVNKVVDSGDILRIPAGELDIRLSD